MGRDEADVLGPLAEHVVGLGEYLRRLGYKEF